MVARLVNEHRPEVSFAGCRGEVAEVRHPQRMTAARVELIAGTGSADRGRRDGPGVDREDRELRGRRRLEQPLDADGGGRTVSRASRRPARDAAGSSSRYPRRC